MGRLVAWTLTLVLLVGVGYALSQPAVRYEFARVTGVAAVLGDPMCEVSLTSGETVLLAPARAQALVDAAIDGTGRPRVRTDSGQVVRSVDLNPTEPGRITCVVRPKADLQAQQPNEIGLTPRASRVRDAVRERFGPIPDGGFAPRGVSTGHGTRSAHYSGLAVDFFFRPYDDPTQRARGWTVANWIAANAARLNIAVLIYDDRIWSARRSAEGWRPYSHPDGYTDPINRHLDHIHVDVIPGSG